VGDDVKEDGDGEKDMYSMLETDEEAEEEKKKKKVIVEEEEEKEEKEENKKENFKDKCEKKKCGEGRVCELKEEGEEECVCI
jgi:hypothetical protein